MSEPKKKRKYNWVDMTILALFLMLGIFISDNHPYRELINVFFGIYLASTLSYHMIRNVAERGADKHVITYVYVIAFVSALILSFSIYTLYQYLNG